LRDYRTILTAVAVAFVIWFVASLDFFPNIVGHIDGIKVSEEPTTYMLNNNLQIIGGVPDDINVQIEGKRYAIEQLKAEDFDAQLDLSTVTQSGRQEVNIYVRPVDATKCTVKNDGL
jgi:YbbR domain-containing protein